MVIYSLQPICSGFFKSYVINLLFKLKYNDRSPIDTASYY